MGFATTRWSLVVQAGRDAGQALGELIEGYWYPLYAYARRYGLDAATAADRVQGFFAALIEKDFLLAADPARGRFRTFLLTAFKRHAAKEDEKAAARKRGGDRRKLSLDFEDGEARYQLEPFHDLTPERLFERRFALELLDRVMKGLGAEYAEREQSDLLEALRPFLVRSVSPEAKAEAAERLGMTKTALRVALHRLRSRYRMRLEAEIRETVSDPAEVEDEIHRLMDAVS